MKMSIADLRQLYHQRICEEIIRITPSQKKAGPYPNFADGDSMTSVSIAKGIVRRFTHEIPAGKLRGQRVGALFEIITRDFLAESFALLQHIRPGKWQYDTGLDIR